MMKTIRRPFLALAALGTAFLVLSCGGAGHTTYPGPTPITLTVQTPAEDTIVTRSVLHVAGQVSLPTATLAVNQKVLPLDAQGCFQADVPLLAGANTVTFQAWGSAKALTGRGSGLLPPQAPPDVEVDRHVTWQVPPLMLRVQSPADGTAFQESPIASQGVVSEPDAALTLNGRPVPVAADGTFSTSLDLTPGSNTFTYVASGSQYATGSDTATVTVTYQPPAPPPANAPIVHLTAPSEGLLTNAATVQVTGTVSDPAAILLVNGVATALDASGAFTATLAPPQGPFTVTAVATNAGGAGQDARHIVVDRIPPVITLTPPLPVTTQNPALPISGSVSKPSALLTLNGQALPVDAQGNFSTIFVLNAGPNTLNFKAVDLPGNVGALTAITTLGSSAPLSIRITSPMDGYATNLDSVPVRGVVSDPVAAVTVQGTSAPVDSQGYFTATVSHPSTGRIPITATGTDASGTASSTVYVTFDTTPPVLQWIDPTPADGTRLTTGSLVAAVAINKAALASINGQRVELQPGPGTTMPFQAQANLAVQEGNLVLTATAVDGAGNSATITRNLAVGLTAPVINVASPAFDVTGTFSTANLGVTLAGVVTAPAFVQPVTFAVNGTAVTPSTNGAFSVPLSLVMGSNPVTLVATNAFGQSASTRLTVTRTQGIAPVGAVPGIAIDQPLPGFAVTAPSVQVHGRVLEAGMTASVQGASVAVDPQTLAFSTTVSLQAGSNTITAVGTDAQGRMATSSLTGTYLPPGAATSTWLTPQNGAHFTVNSSGVTGTATLPGITSITINGLPMTLNPGSGTFSGTVPLRAPGLNALVLVATALDGTTRQEQRQVSYEPPLPVVVLKAPASARPGDSIMLQVGPGTGTNLAKADLSWNGRFLQTETAPWAAVPVQVPSNAAIGSLIPVSALGTDMQGNTVTAQTSVLVYGSGALLVQTHDDSKGLPLTDSQGQAALVGGTETQPLDPAGRAALSTALPQNWIQVTHPGFTPVWRSAGLTVGGVQQAVDARLTPMTTAQSADAAGLTAAFGKGALTLILPAGALGSATSLSITPLSTHGLPALLPSGWSVVSAWWVDLAGAALAVPATATLDVAPTLAATSPSLPTGGTYAWAYWDPTQNVWSVLATPRLSALATLPVPSEGGYALVLADPAPTAPPSPVVGSVLSAFAGSTWTDGMAAAGSITPSLLPSAEAINGAKATGCFTLAYGSLAPIPSATILQAEAMENYILTDQSLIEPDAITEDLVASQWMLEISNGAPLLTGVTQGLGIHMPVNMSRTFTAGQLVQGRILLGFYHNGLTLTQGGSGLIGASGGSVSQAGITVSLAAGAVSGTTLVRITQDGGDPATLWPELVGQGTVAQSFAVDVVGTLSTGLGIHLDTLDAPYGVRPILVERRVVQSQSVVAAVGELVPQGSGWALSATTPVLSGGDFSVLLPASSWDWTVGTATVPATASQAILGKAGASARFARKAADVSAPLAVPDVSVTGGLLAAISGADGTFAAPCLSGAGAVTLNGTRWDLGLAGSVQVQVPSQGDALILSITPFAVDGVLPDPSQPIPVGTVFQVITVRAHDFLESSAHVRIERPV